MATKSDDHYLIELSSAEELQEASPSRKRYDKKVIRIVLLSFLLLCAVVVIIILLIPELFGDASASNKSTGSDSRFGKLIFNEEFNEFNLSRWQHEITQTIAPIPMLKMVFCISNRH
eukprot:337130_1